MKADNFDLAAYLRRIGFRGPAGPDLETLIELMRAQLQSVPFENLDIQAGAIVSLAPEDMVRKIVGERRGGYCYELNGVFAMALQALGIEYWFIAARPRIYAARRPKTHMAVLARLGGEMYLCDMGFGSHGIRAPMALSRHGQPIAQDGDTYRLVPLETGMFRLEALLQEAWAPQYEFDLAPQEHLDFAPANFFNSRHPDSMFVQKLIVVMQTARGRMLLVDRRLTTLQDGRATAHELDDAGIGTALADVFGLRRPAPQGQVVGRASSGAAPAGGGRPGAGDRTQ